MGKQFQEKVREMQNKLEEYLEWFNKCPIKEIDSNNGENNNVEVGKEGLPLKIIWEETKDEEKAIRIIIKLANLLSPLRGILQTWETKETQGTEYAFSLPIIEEPDRAIHRLRNLARGSALNQGRNYITIEDIPLIIKVVLSTASIERVRILDLLLNAEGKLSSSQIEFSLNISKPTAKRTMVEFKGLGIVDLLECENENSEKTIQLKPKFSWFLSKEFQDLRDGFTPDVEIDDKKESPIVLQEKYPPNTLYDFGNQNTHDQEEEIEQEKESFECYYCNDFDFFDKPKEYEKHTDSPNTQTKLHIRD